MSFDIFFQPCRYQSKRVQKKNPFTAEVQWVSVSDPLSASELNAVNAVLQKNTTEDSDGCCSVDLPEWRNRQCLL